MMQNHNLKLKSLLIYFGVAMVVCLGVNHDIFKNYAFLDVYELLYTAKRADNFQEIFIVNGRPLLGFWSEVLYGDIIKLITELKWVRLFSSIFCVLFSTQVYNYLLRLNYGLYESAIFALLILALPTFTVYFAWSATAQIPLLLIANFYAGQLLLDKLEHNKIWSLGVFIAFIIVLLTMFMYQSAATLFVVPFILKSIKNENLKLNIAFRIIGFTFIVYLIYFILFKIMMVSTGFEASNRTALNPLSLPKRIIKFYLFELRTLLKNSGFLMLPKMFLLLGFSAFSGFLISFYFKHKSLLFLAALVFVLPFCYAPNLLSNQSFFSLRAIPTTAIIVLFYQFWFVRFLILKYKCLKPLILIIPMTLVVLSGYNQKTYVAGLQHNEYRILKKTYSNFKVSSDERLTIIRPKYGLLKRINYIDNEFSDEFGNLSSVKDWVPNHLFCQIKWEQLTNKNQNLEPYPLKNITVISENSSKTSSGKIIDLVDVFKKHFVEE